MAEAKTNRFTKYFPLLLDALRSADPNPMRPPEAMAWIRAKMEVPAEDLTRFVQNGTQSIFENDVHWARFYLVKAGLIGNAKRGLWNLNPKGRDASLSPEETWNLYVRIRDASRSGNSPVDEDAPAPGTTGEDEEEGKSYWFVGAWNGTEDLLPRFIEQGIWENGWGATAQTFGRPALAMFCVRNGSSGAGERGGMHSPHLTNGRADASVLCYKDESLDRNCDIGVDEWSVDRDDRRARACPQLGEENT